jgi:hypothetical protein
VLIQVWEARELISGAGEGARARRGGGEREASEVDGSPTREE